MESWPSSKALLVPPGPETAFHCSGSERQEQRNQTFLRLPNHYHALSSFTPCLERGGRRKIFGVDIQSQLVEGQVTGPSPSHKPLVSS